MNNDFNYNAFNYSENEKLKAIEQLLTVILEIIILLNRKSLEEEN